MKDNANRCVDGDGVRTGHRVGHGDELDVKGSDADALVVAHLNKGAVLIHLGLGEAVTSESNCQRRTVEGCRDVAKQVPQRTRVVFVSVGQDDAVHSIGTLLEPGKVRQDQVDAVHRGLGKHQPGIYDEESTLLLENHAVPANLTETAEEVNLDGRLSHVGHAVRQVRVTPHAEESRRRCRAEGGIRPLEYRERSLQLW